MLDLDSPLAPHAQLRTLRQELDLYQPGLPWARSRRAVIAANNPNPNPNPNPNRNPLRASAHRRRAWWGASAMAAGRVLVAGGV